MVYDITNTDTFGRAKVWVKELQRQASPNIVIALAGNKADLAAKRAVEFDEAKTYAEENGLLFMETSAKTAMNVNDIFLAIGKQQQSKQRDFIVLMFQFVCSPPQPRSCPRTTGQPDQVAAQDRAEGSTGLRMPTRLPRPAASDHERWKFGQNSGQTQNTPHRQDNKKKQKSSVSPQLSSCPAGACSFFLLIISNFFFAVNHK